MKKHVLSALILVLLAAGSLPLAAQQSQANGRTAHVGLPVDWSFRQMMHHSANTPEFTSAAQAEPRVLYNWMYRNSKKGASPDGRASRGRLKGNAPKASLKVDWNAPLGIGTVAPNMSPAKYTFDINAIPSCSADYVVYALNVQGSATQPNLVAFNNLYSGALAAASTIGANGATESGTTVTITTAAAHGLVVGDTVVVAGLGTAGYNGTWVVTAAPSATTVQYTALAGLTTPGTGTGTATKSGLCGLTPSVAWAYNTATSNGTPATIAASPLGAVEAG